MNTNSIFEVDMDKLNSLSKENMESYKQADPFPHIAIENFLNSEVLEGVLQEVEEFDNKNWHLMDDRYQKKWANSITSTMGPKTRNLLQFLNGQEIMNFLEELTGIEGLVPDPYLAGGGLHQLREGGFLGVHADFNYQKQIRLDRRINLLIYLNKDWDESYGGGLELWDTEMKSCVKSYTPDFNKCVIFNTTDTSFHGNPQPVCAPNGRPRRSIALYYYTNGRPSDELTDEHMTLFQYRPGEASIADKSRRILKEFIPPIITKALGRGKVR